MRVALSWLAVVSGEEFVALEALGPPQVAQELRLLSFSCLLNCIMFQACDLLPGNLVLVVGCLEQSPVVLGSVVALVPPEHTPALLPLHLGASVSLGRLPRHNWKHLQLLLYLFFRLEILLHRLHVQLPFDVL